MSNYYEQHAAAYQNGIAQANNNANIVKYSILDSANRASNLVQSAADLQNAKDGAVGALVNSVAGTLQSAASTHTQFRNIAQTFKNGRLQRQEIRNLSNRLNDTINENMSNSANDIKNTIQSAGSKVSDGDTANLATSAMTPKSAIPDELPFPEVSQSVQDAMDKKFGVDQPAPTSATGDPATGPPGPTAAPDPYPPTNLDTTIPIDNSVPSVPQVNPLADPSLSPGTLFPNAPPAPAGAVTGGTAAPTGELPTSSSLVDIDSTPLQGLPQATTQKAPDGGVSRLQQVYNQNRGLPEETPLPDASSAEQTATSAVKDVSTATKTAEELGDASKTADIIAGSTEEIPGLDVATDVIAGLTTLGTSIYDAFHKKASVPPPPDPANIQAPTSGGVGFGLASSGFQSSSGAGVA